MSLHTGCQGFVCLDLSSICRNGMANGTKLEVFWLNISLFVDIFVWPVKGKFRAVASCTHIVSRVLASLRRFGRSGSVTQQYYGDESVSVPGRHPAAARRTSEHSFTRTLNTAVVRLGSFGVEGHIRCRC